MRTLTPKQHIVRTRNADFSVWEYPGDGTPLFFCHCTGVSGRVWESVFRTLSLNHTLFAWDARGHGDSAKSPEAEAYTWDSLARDLLGVFDQMGLPEGMQAVGHSGGGSTIVQAELIRPGTFSRLMLVDAIIALPDFFAGAKLLAKLVRRRRSRFSSRQEARERFSAKEPMNMWTGDSLDCYLKYCFFQCDGEEILLKCPGDIEAWVYEMSDKTEIMSRLPQLQMPVLLITGENSYMQQYVEEQHKRIAGSEMQVIPGAGHFLAQEKPEEIAAVMNRWFAPSEGIAQAH